MQLWLKKKYLGILFFQNNLENRNSGIDNQGFYDEDAISRYTANTEISETEEETKA